MSQYISASLRQEVFDRAGEQCEYCFTPQIVTLVSHEVDHIIAQKHGGGTESENLALACSLCNKYKGSDLASIDSETGAITPLYNPRTDNWLDHFRLEEAKLIALTAIGRVTVNLLKLNQPERITERENLLNLGLIQIPQTSER